MPKGYHILTVTHRNTKLNALGQFAVQCEEGGPTAAIVSHKRGIQS